MKDDERLRLSDVRATYRLVGECTELGLDSQAWRRHMLQGLCTLTGARVALYMHLHSPLTPAERLTEPMDVGFLDDDQRRLWMHYQQENAQRDDAFHLAYFGTFQPGLFTRDLRSVIDLTSWHGGRHYNDYVRPSKLEDRITSSLNLPASPGAPVQVIVLHRDTGDKWFPRSATRLVRLFHDELRLALNKRLVLPGSAADVAHLSPRLRDVLSCLLEGDTEKQAARRLGISRHTVSNHVQRLYRHFDVRSRAELMGRCYSLLGARQRTSED